MVSDNIRRVAASLTDTELLQIGCGINADLATHIASGQPSTQAHFGLLEMAQACADELETRGYRNGRKADGSDLPVDVWYETVCGITTRLTFGIRCF